MSKELFKSYSNQIEKNYKINPSLYDKYDIKQGLRNKNNTGVRIGMTKIGDVEGYKIDGEIKIPMEGRLSYRGLDLEELLNKMYIKKTYYFERILYLILVGHLPTEDELQELLECFLEIKKKNIDFFIRDIGKNEIMNALQRGMLYMYTFDDKAEEISIENLITQAVFINAVFPHLLVESYLNDKLDHHKHYELVNKKASISEYVLKMIKGLDVSYEDIEILDTLLCVHAEHGGGNNSTFTARVTSSAYTDTYSSLSAAIGSLKGQRHGGANSMALNMINDMKSKIDVTNEKEIKSYLQKVMQKKEFDKKGLIYGIGHAVYTMSDPRAVILKEKAKCLSKKKGCYENFKVYEYVEKISKELFKEKMGSDFEICANVDLYSGFIYDMLEIDPCLFTPFFALSRVPTWCAHRIEQIYNEKKIIRPAYVTVLE